MKPVMMLNRIMRYDTKQLLELFNKTCDKAGMPDPERKVVFDTQADVISVLTHHEAGKSLNPQKLVVLTQKPFNKRDLPEGLRGRLVMSQKILSKYPSGDDISQAALLAIIKQYFQGGVFKPTEVK